MGVVIKAGKGLAWRRTASSCNASQLSRFPVVIEYLYSPGKSDSKKKRKTNKQTNLIK